MKLLNNSRDKIWFCGFAFELLFCCVCRVLGSEVSSSSYDHAAYALLSCVILQQGLPLVGSGTEQGGVGG